MRIPIPLLHRSFWPTNPKFAVDEDDRSVLEEGGTLLLPMQRGRLIRYLPAGGKVAEIGVARGRFSAQIVDVCRPSFLALVDPWRHQGEDTYFNDGNNAKQGEQDRRHDAIVRRYVSDKAGRERQVLRMYSVDAAAKFEAGFFDWVFIDGNHSYEACLEDLRVWNSKVHADGLLCGHDFAAHAAARSSRYGVIDAVKQFIGETGYGLAAITIEHFPTFVIAKSMSGQTLRRMRQLMFSRESHLVQLAGWNGDGISHARLLSTGKPRSSFLSIRLPAS